MIWVVKIAWRDKTGTEKYRTETVKATWMAHAYEAVASQMKKGERIIQVSEGGYQ